MITFVLFVGLCCWCYAAWLLCVRLLDLFVMFVWLLVVWLVGIGACGRFGSVWVYCLLCCFACLGGLRVACLGDFAWVLRFAFGDCGFVILLCLLFVVVLVRLVCVYASWFATFLVAGWFRCLD